MQKTKQAKSPRLSPSELQQYECLAGGAGVGGLCVGFGGAEWWG